MRVKPPNDDALARDIEGLQNDLSDYADQVDWCGEFEEAMKAVGLRSVRSEAMEWTGTAVVTIDLAKHAAQIYERIYEAVTGETLLRHSWVPHEPTVTGTAVLATYVEGQINTVPGACVCDQVKALDASELSLPEWAEDAIEIRLEDVSCDSAE